MASDHAVDETFPQGARFGMSLECMLNWQNHGAVDGGTKTSLVPVGVLIIDTNKCWLIRRR